VLLGSACQGAVTGEDRGETPLHYPQGLSRPPPKERKWGLVLSQELLFGPRRSFTITELLLLNSHCYSHPSPERSRRGGVKNDKPTGTGDSLISVASLVLFVFLHEPMKRPRCGFLFLRTRLKQKVHDLNQRCQTHFHRGPHQHHGRPLKGPETLYKLLEHIVR